MAYIPLIKVPMAVPITHTTHQARALAGPAPSTSSPTSQQGQILNPSEIAGITIGILVAAVLAFFALGTIINHFHVRKRAKKNQQIEAQHRRWPSTESRYPVLAAAMCGRQHYIDVEKDAGMPVPQYYIPGVSKDTILSHLNRQNPGSEAQVDREKIGIAVSPDVGTMDSPESYHSESSQTNLLCSKFSKALPAPPPSFTPPRPESNCTVFEDFRQSQMVEPTRNSVLPTAQAGSATLNRSSSLRPRQPPPAKLRIPTDPSSPPPIVVFPPNRNEPAQIVNIRPVGTHSDQSQGSSRSTSSSPPPSYAAFPTPPVAKKPRGNTPQLVPPTRTGSRKDTPSYLPAYYTSPTPPAVVPPRMSNQGSFNASQAMRDNATFASPPTTAGPELDPSSASSNGSDTSFESVISPDATPPEQQSPYTAPIPTDPESPLRSLRYPKIPRSSNQGVSRVSPMGTKASDAQDNSNASSSAVTLGNCASLLEKRRGQDAANKLEKKLWITDSNVKQPPAPPAARAGTNIAIQGQQPWPQRRSSKREPPRASANQGPERGQRWESKMTPRMRNGDMILEVSSP